MQRTFLTHSSSVQTRPHSLCLRDSNLLRYVFLLLFSPPQLSAAKSLTLKGFMTLLKAARHELCGEELKRELESQAQKLSTLLYKVRPDEVSVSYQPSVLRVQENA